LIDIILLISLTLFMVANAMHLVRVIKGPSMPDRAIAFDIIGINLISSMAIISILLKTTAFLEAILIIGILSFIGTIAFSKYIERGVIIERKSDY